MTFFIRKTKASVTVYMTMVMTLLFSFVMSLLSVATVRGTKATIECYAKSAGESILGEYYYPLYEDYHIFAIDGGYGTRTMDVASLEKNLQNYCKYGVENGSESFLFSPESLEITLDNYELLASGSMDAFYEQAVNYMTLREPIRVTEQLAKLANAGEETNVVKEIISKQEDLLQSIVVTEKKVQQLMELIDGVKMNDQGPRFTSEGTYIPNSTFVKMFVFDKKFLRDKYSDPNVYDAVEDRMINPVEMINGIVSLTDLLINDMESLAELNQSLEIAEKKTVLISNEIIILYEERDAMEDEEEIRNNEIIIAEYKKELEELKESKEELEKAVKKQQGTVNDSAKQTNDAVNRLSKKMNTLYSCINDAGTLVTKIKKEQKGIKDAISVYDKFLKSRTEGISKDVRKVFEEDLVYLKGFYGTDNSSIVSQLEKIEKSLLADQGIVDEIKSISSIGNKPDLDSVKELKKALQRAARSSEKYTTDGMWFTYSGYKEESVKYGTIKKFIEDIYSSGILALVGVDVRFEGLKTTDFGDALSAIRTEEDDATILNALEQMKQFLDDKSFTEAISGIYEKSEKAFLFEAYLNDTFNCFTDGTPKGRALRCEREYMLFGKPTDIQNLKYMAASIAAIRFLVNFPLIMTNAEKMAEINSVAVSVSASTALPVLYPIVKYAIVTVWALEEAIVETAALLDGKTIPIISTGNISFSELMLFTPALVETKAKAMTSAPVGVRYVHFVSLFSAVQNRKEKQLRALDVIQENIQKDYKKSFLIKNAITSVTFSGQYTVNYKYTSSTKKNENFSFTKTANYQ